MNTNQLNDIEAEDKYFVDHQINYGGKERVELYHDSDEDSYEIVVRDRESFEAVERSKDMGYRDAKQLLDAAKEIDIKQALESDGN